MFTVRQAVEDSPGIAATKLYQTLMTLTGCSDKTAKKAAFQAVDLGYIRREEKGKYVNYFPAGLGKSEHFPNVGETEGGHE